MFWLTQHLKENKKQDTKKIELIIYPILDIKQISGTKVDLRLDNTFHLVERIGMKSYDPADYQNKDPPTYLRKHFVTYGDSFILHPGELVLAPTFESVKLPHNVLVIIKYHM